MSVSFPFSALGKASILNEPHGFVKVVSDRPIQVRSWGCTWWGPVSPN